MRLGEVRGPVDDGEEQEAEGKQHQGVPVHGPVLGATVHDEVVDEGGKPRHRVAGPRARRLQDRGVLGNNAEISMGMMMR